MTLSLGNQVTKLDGEGVPLTPEQEGYITFEVVGLTSGFRGTGVPAYVQSGLESKAFSAADDLFLAADETYQLVLVRTVI